MPISKKRDNAYYLSAMKRSHPSTYAAYIAGAYGSVTEARRACGMLSARTPLHELKNAWGKATSTERGLFADWLKAKRVRSVARGPTDADGRLELWAIDRIRHLMKVKGIRMGQLLAQWGLKSLNASLGNALKSQTRIGPLVIAKLAKWLEDNRGVV